MLNPIDAVFIPCLFSSTAACLPLDADMLLVVSIMHRSATSACAAVVGADLGLVEVDFAIVLADNPAAYSISWHHNQRAAPVEYRYPYQSPHDSFSGAL